MASAGRDVVAVLAGAVLWAVLWVGGSALAAPMVGVVAGQPITDTGVLLGYIGYSVLLSVLAGYTAAAVAGQHDPMRPVRWLAGVQLLLGIVFEVSAWSLTPVWYHLVFLVLLVPAVLLGGRLRAAGAARAGSPARG